MDDNHYDFQIVRAPGVLGAALIGGLAVFAWQRLIRHPDPPLGEPVVTLNY